MLDSDRDIIEDAAKANGFHVKGWVGDKLSYFDPITEHSGFGDWNPIENNSDAFELIAKFDLSSLISLDYSSDRKPKNIMMRSIYSPDSGYDGCHSQIVIGHDKAAALRRAVSIAAAAKWKYKNA